MSQLSSYTQKYRNIAFERRDGILEMRVHTDGGPMRWGADPGCVHEQLGYAFYDVAHDVDNKVVILTGTGDAFCKDRNTAEYSEAYSADYWYRITREGRDMLFNLLDIDVPVISAINGPATIHSELAILADIVLAADTTIFRDTHMSLGVVPGDGCHAVWNLLLGRSRGHYYLMTSETLSVQRAFDFGIVHEILSPTALMTRARELANKLAAKPTNTLRYSRALFAQPLKESLQRELAFGLALEGLSVGALSESPIKHSG
jgi:enoyl-CoA hydratase/carnithine racemase